MSKDSRAILWAIAAATALIVAWTFWLPVLQAQWRYGAAVDDLDRCAAADDVAYAWAGAGAAGKAAEWRDEAKVHCALARLGQP